MSGLGSFMKAPIHSRLVDLTQTLHEAIAMRIYSNPTTHRLEYMAKRMGCACEIKVMEPSPDGRYFLTKVDNKQLKRPASLGWTDQHATTELKRGRWKTDKPSLL